LKTPVTSPELAGEISGPKAGAGWGWGLCWLLFAATTLNYMDRQAIAVVGERIAAEFQIRFEDLGWVIAAFQLPYALFQVPAGFLADRWDVRKTYALAVAWWSIAAMAVAWSPSLGALMAFRAVLGMGESFNWPCALKVTATVLPPADRSLGNGIFNSGAAVGAVLTPLIVAPLTVWFGWRVAFELIGVAGLVWVAGWLLVVNGPARRLFVSAPPQPISARPATGLARWAFVGLLAVATLGGIFGFLHETPVTMSLTGEPGTIWAWRAAPGASVRKGGALVAVDRGGVRSIITSTDEGIVSAHLHGAGEKVKTGEEFVRIRVKTLGLSAFWLAIAFLMIGGLALARAIPTEQLGESGWLAALGEVVRLRRFWVLAVVSVSINVCWHFLVNWLPTYLKTDRRMEFVAGSLLSAVPFLAADVGNLGGGWVSRWLARRGLGASRARATVLGGCVFLIAAGAGVGSIRDNGVTIVLLAIMALGTAAFMANYFAYCQEVSARRTGLVVGILGGIGNLFAAGFAPIAGRIKDTSGGFGPVFLIVGLLPFVGLAAVLLGWGRDEEPDPVSAG
jgi:ACS family hexuronate transporter-like MFS transporter